MQSPVATRNGEEWVFSEPKTSLPIGPVNGNTTALLCVTRKGIIRICTQQRNARFHDIAFELDDVVRSGDILTHAAFANEKGNLSFFVVTENADEVKRNQYSLSCITRPASYEFIEYA